MRADRPTAEGGPSGRLGQVRRRVADGCAGARSRVTGRGGEDGFAAYLADALRREVMTQREVEQALAAHEFVRGQR